MTFQSYVLDVALSAAAKIDPRAADVVAAAKRIIDQGVAASDLLKGAAEAPAALTAAKAAAPHLFADLSKLVAPAKGGVEPTDGELAVAAARATGSPAPAWVDSDEAKLFDRVTGAS